MTVIETILSSVRNSGMSSIQAPLNKNTPLQWDKITTFDDLDNANLIIKLSYPGSIYSTVLELDQILVNKSFTFVTLTRSPSMLNVIEAVAPETMLPYLIGCDDVDLSKKEILSLLGKSVTERILNEKPIVDVLVFFDLPSENDTDQYLIEMVKYVKPEFVLIIGH